MTDSIFKQNAQTIISTNYRFYLPNETKESNHYVTRFLNVLNRITGGSTVYNGKGLWVDEHGKILKEKVVIVEAFAQLDKEQEKAIFETFAEYGIHTSQSHLAVVVDGAFYLINVETLKYKKYHYRGKKVGRNS